MTFDASIDYASYPTLAPLPENTPSLSAYISCPFCDGTAFRLRQLDRMPICIKCGYALEPEIIPEENPVEILPSIVHDLPQVKASEQDLISEPVPVSRAPVDPSRFQIVRGADHTVILHPNGTVKAVGDNKNGQCNVQDWKNIVSIATNQFYTVGLCENGTVRIAGGNFLLRSKVSEWKNVTSIAAGNNFLVGRCADGSVKSAGIRLPTWSGVTAIAACGLHVAALCEDGTIRMVGVNNHGMCNIHNWYGITGIALGGYHTVGLSEDGTVRAAGYCKTGKQEPVSRCAVDKWTRITAIAAGKFHTVGLHQSGWVFAIGANTHGQCNVSAWNDIVAICAGETFTAGLRSDGTVLCTDPTVRKLLEDIYC